jgi:MerR family transcriptional regulator, heat shock protein HspR
MSNNLTKKNFMDVDKGLFPISIVAEIIDVHQRTLRIYDEMNILRPSRSIKNRRLYSFNDIEKAKFINYLTTDLGVNLVGIKIIMHFLSEQKIKVCDYKNKIEEIKGILHIDSVQNYKKRGRKKACA